jgi:hypothetical protein
MKKTAGEKPAEAPAARRPRAPRALPAGLGKRGKGL